MSCIEDAMAGVPQDNEASQADLHCYESAEEALQGDEPNVVPPPPPRKPAAKRPRVLFVEDEPVAPELPDLSQIFDEFDIDPRVRIRLCRAYANYLSQQLPRVGKRL